jgi:CubicO group peptidase (beta-lactamase class C family)
MKRILFLPLLLISVATLASANDAVDDWVSQFIQKKTIPGVALLVRQNGRIAKMQGYGLANIEHQVAAIPQTVFQSGSMGKQFTAIAVMMLTEEGKLNIDDPVSKYLNVPDTWKDIKIRHLLTHTSGLGDYPESFDMRRDYTEDDIFKMVTASRLLFAPGEKWSYSNLGFVALGVLIHKVSGKFYGDLLQERIFKPLGMTSTRIISEHDIIPHRAAGYVLENGALKNQRWVSKTVNTTADGSLYFTIEDLAKWDEALESKKLVSETSYREMWSPVKLNNGTTAEYGFGWRVSKAPNGDPLIGHGGAWQGFATVIARYPKQRLTVVALSNRAGADVSYIARHVAGMIQPGLGAPKPKRISLEPAKLQKLAGDYREQTTITISVEGDHLCTIYMGKKRVLWPTSELAFFEEDSDHTYTFTREASGQISGLTIAVPEKIIFRKVK